VKASLGNSLLGSSVVEAYQARARVVADRKVEELVNNSKAILRGKDKSALEELIARGTNTVEHAGPRAQADWKSMLQKSEKAGLLSRSGGE